MTTSDAPTGEPREEVGDGGGPPIWLIHNPLSRSGAKQGERLRAVAEASGGEIAWRAPETLEDLREVVAEATAAGAEILAIHGGDGTVHRVLSALVVHLGGGAPGPHLRDLPVPQLMILKAGTVNIVAGNIGAPSDGATRLRGLLKIRAEGGTPETKELALTVVNGRHAGFIFGTGAIPRTMDAYYQGGDASIWKSAKVIGRGVVSTLVGGAFARGLFHRDPYTVTVDGELWPGDGWGAVCVGTVPRMALGFAPLYTVRQSTGHLHVVAIRCGTRTIATTIHNLWLGRPNRREGFREGPAQEVCVEGPDPVPFNMDGDSYPGSTRLVAQRGPVLSFIARP